MTTFLGNPQKRPFLLSVRNNFMVKKEAKIAKTAMYVRNIFSKIGNYSVHTEEFCYFGRPERTEYYIIFRMLIGAYGIFPKRAYRIFFRTLNTPHGTVPVRTL